jgi:uncharacterized protein (DUF1501 family)
MKRRSFIRNISLAASAPFLVGGLPVKALSNSLTRLLGNGENDRVLIMIQLAGGNDGLNTLIPLDQYGKYMEYRANIAIPDSGDRKYLVLDPELSATEQLGLHPDMTHIRDLYQEGRCTVVQNVGYNNMNLSHFRGRDIWFMGGGSDDYFKSGWMGRYLDHIYAGYPDGYPNAEMPDPLGLETGYSMSLLYQREAGIPAGLAVADPDTFYQLVTGTGIEPPSYIPEDRSGEELKYLIDIELKSNQYAERIKQVYEAGTNSPGVIYPETYPFNAPQNVRNNELAWQLKIIARLLSGGIKTRVFLVRIDGFDTHAGQAIESDPTMGVHAALLYHLSSAIKAFYEDLDGLGLSNRVICFTTSEFGRRVYSNASLGTDHGKAAPLILFGSGLKGGVLGNAPDLNNLDDGNLIHQFDYRQIYTSLLMDWLGADAAAVEASRFGDFIDTRLDLVRDFDGLSEANSDGFALTCYPNPARDFTVFSCSVLRYETVNLSLFDSSGKLVRVVYSGRLDKGSHEFRVSLEGLPAGIYLVKLNSQGSSKSLKLIKQ